jgi:hypothetical protein
MAMSVRGLKGKRPIPGSLLISQQPARLQGSSLLIACSSPARLPWNTTIKAPCPDPLPPDPDRARLTPRDTRDLAPVEIAPSYRSLVSLPRLPAIRGRDLAPVSPAEAERSFNTPEREGIEGGRAGSLWSGPEQPGVVGTAAAGLAPRAPGRRHAGQQALCSLRRGPCSPVGPEAGADSGRGLRQDRPQRTPVPRTRPCRGFIAAQAVLAQQRGQPC